MVAVLGLMAPTMASVVSDLEGARAAGALDDMARRGYVQTGNYAADGGRYSYWWNQQSGSCIRLLTRDGRIAATKTSPASDCGQRSKSNDGTAAAIAAAAALIGVAALASKSHHRDDQEYQSPDQYAEFERGHRDGLYGHAFHDYNNSSEYRSGYDSGVRERGQQSRYRQGTYYDRATPQRAAPAYFEDLVGARARGALSELESRGFRRVDNFQSGDKGAGTIWWNRSTRQCLQAITVDGHIDSLMDIQTHPKCR